MTPRGLYTFFAVLLGVAALADTTTAAQDADRSAALPAAVSQGVWEAAASKIERLRVQQPSLIELVAYRFATGGLQAQIVPATEAKGSTASDILASTGAVLVINGGYFDRAGDGTLTPTGLLLSAGQTIAPLTVCRACSGVLSSEQGVLAIGWAKGYVAGPDAESAVQVGPVLVEPVGQMGINKPGGPTAERSAICLAKGQTILVAVTSRITLHELATILQAAPPGGFGCDAAINLDGGPSTQIATTVSGQLETFGNISPVQNFVAFFAPK